jgi:hypothetical protein
MKATWMLLMFAATTACGHREQAGQGRGAGTRPVDQRSWTVFPGTQTDKLRKLCSRAFPEGLTGHWTPSDQEVAEPEAALSALLSEEFQKRPWMTRQPQYVRQYAGFERAGQRVIYVNAFAGLGPVAQEALDICDGGAIAFGAVFDLAKHRYDWFQTNGPYNGKLLPAQR